MLGIGVKGDYDWLAGSIKNILAIENNAKFRNQATP